MNGMNGMHAKYEQRDITRQAGDYATDRTRHIADCPSTYCPVYARARTAPQRS